MTRAQFSEGSSSSCTMRTQVISTALVAYPHGLRAPPTLSHRGGDGDDAVHGACSLVVDSGSVAESP